MMDLPHILKMRKSDLWVAVAVLMRSLCDFRVQPKLHGSFFLHVDKGGMDALFKVGLAEEKRLEQ